MAQNDLGLPEGFADLGQHDTFVGMAGPFFWRLLDRKTETLLDVRTGHLDADGAAHPGVLLTLMDVTLGTTAGAWIGHVGVYPTIQLDASFCGTAQLGERVMGEAWVTAMTDKLAHVSGRLHVAGRTILNAQSVFRNPPAARSGAVIR